MKQRVFQFSLCPCTPLWPLRGHFLFFFVLLYEYSAFFLRCLKHKLSAVPPELGRTGLGAALQMEPFSPHMSKSTQEGQTRCPHKLSLHRPSLFLCLAVPHEQSEGLPCGRAGRRGICICIFFFFQYLLWTEDQKLTGEKKQAADWHLLKTLISPNLVPSVILERPLWPVGAGEGSRLLKGWRCSGPGL